MSSVLSITPRARSTAHRTSSRILSMEEGSRLGSGVVTLLSPGCGVALQSTFHPWTGRARGCGNPSRLRDRFLGRHPHFRTGLNRSLFHSAGSRHHLIRHDPIRLLVNRSEVFVLAQVEEIMSAETWERISRSCDRSACAHRGSQPRIDAGVRLRAHQLSVHQCAALGFIAHHGSGPRSRQQRMRWVDHERHRLRGPRVADTVRAVVIRTVEVDVRWLQVRNLVHTAQKGSASRSVIAPADCKLLDRMRLAMFS